MIRAAVEAAGPAGILVVTVLTSIDEAMLTSVGVAGGIDQQVGRMSGLAAGEGAEGVVCSMGELATAQAIAPGLIRVVPGIRPGGVAHHDQARVATPSDALAAGANYLVIGRAITAAHDPVGSAAEISESLAATGASADR